MVRPTGVPTAAVVVAGVTLNPAGVIDTGDCKDHYGADQGDEQDNYITYIRNKLPWGTVNAGVNATYPILPGNHDEIYDYTDTAGTDLMSNAMTERQLAGIVLAAGHGTRMRSDRPKVLHEVAGRPLINHVMAALRLDVLQASSPAGAKALARTFDAPKKALIVLQPVFKPLFFRLETDKYARRLAVPRDDDVLLLCFAKKVREVVLCL